MLSHNKNLVLYEQTNQHFIYSYIQNIFLLKVYSKYIPLKGLYMNMDLFWFDLFPVAVQGRNQHKA